MTTDLTPGPIPGADAALRRDLDEDFTPMKDTDEDLDEDLEPDEDELEQLVTAGLDPDREADDRPPLFDGDAGTLTMVQRNAMNAVVKAKFITAEEHPETWRVLVANRTLITSRLHDQYKHLHMYVDRGLAYVVDISQPVDGRKFTLLGRHRKFTREETAILAYIRHRYDVEMAAGQPAAVVERREILDHVALMQPTWLADKAAAAKRGTASLDRVMEKFGLLTVVPGEEQTYRIHRAIELFLGLEDVRRLDAAFRAQYADARTDPSQIDPEAGPGPGDGAEPEEGLFDE